MTYNSSRERRRLTHRWVRVVWKNINTNRTHPSKKRLNSKKQEEQAEKRKPNREKIISFKHYRSRLNIFLCPFSLLNLLKQETSFVGTIFRWSQDSKEIFSFIYFSMYHTTIILIQYNFSKRIYWNCFLLILVCNFRGSTRFCSRTAEIKKKNRQIAENNLISWVKDCDRKVTKKNLQSGFWLKSYQKNLTEDIQKKSI